MKYQMDCVQDYFANEKKKFVAKSDSKVISQEHPQPYKKGTSKHLKRLGVVEYSITMLEYLVFNLTILSESSQN